jgi:hypothetical protein
VHDDEVAVEEDGVDHAAHEPRVNRVCGPDQHAFAFPERRTAEQAAQASEECVGEQASLAGGPAVNVFQRDFH